MVGRMGGGIDQWRFVKIEWPSTDRFFFPPHRLFFITIEISLNVKPVPLRQKSNLFFFLTVQAVFLLCSLLGSAPQGRANS